MATSEMSFDHTSLYPRVSTSNGPRNWPGPLMALAFATTFGATRAVTHMIRAGFGPFGNLVVGRWRIHHFVTGILVAFVAGGLSIGLRREQLDRWFAILFGSGVALVLDEAALLLELEDVYWSRKGVLSVQITLATGALLASLGLVVRLLRRGERDVLGAQDDRIAYPGAAGDSITANA
jgi:hypothetical protein